MAIPKNMPIPSNDIAGISLEVLFLLASSGQCLKCTNTRPKLRLSFSTR
jgi:hypothetical protein